jgi:hypothetical protein
VRRCPRGLLVVAIALAAAGCSADLPGASEQTPDAPPSTATARPLTADELRSALLTPEHLGNFRTSKDLDGRRLGVGCLAPLFIDDARPHSAEVTMVGKSIFQFPDVMHGLVSLPTSADAEALMTSFRSRIARCTKIPFGSDNPLHVRFADDTVRTDLNTEVQDEINVAGTHTTRIPVSQGFYQGKAVVLPLTIRYIAARIGNVVVVTVVAAIDKERQVGLVTTMVMNAAITRLRHVLRHESPPPPTPLDLHVTVPEDVLGYVR